MNAQPYADVVQHRRNNGSLNNIEIRNTNELCHQEGSRTHNRRHELTAGRSSSFNCASKSRTIAKFFHHRNGESAGAGNVTNGAAGNSTHKAGGKHGNLCRTASCPACNSVSQIDKEFAQAGSLQISTEQNEQIDEGRGYAHRCTKNTLSREIQMVKHFLNLNATVSHNARNIRTKESIQHEAEGYNNHRPAYNTTCSFKNHQRTNETDDEVRFIIHACTQHQLLIINYQVQSTSRADKSKCHIQRMHLIA